MDVALTIQADVDDTVYATGPQIVPISAGYNTLSSTLHLGYGDTNQAFSTIQLTGAGFNYVGDGDPFKGTLLTCTFNDQPGLNIQGGRYSAIAGLTIRGVNRNAIYQAVPAIVGLDATVDSLNKANWCGAEMTENPNYNSRTAPYAGITIDAYAGARPATSYPDAVYPDAAAPTQWNKATSSGTQIEKVGVYGFYVGLCTAPSGSDGNGDFLECDHVSFGMVIYGISVSHTQARISTFHHCSFYQVHTALTTTAFGIGQGGAGVFIHHCDFSQVVQLFETQTAFAGAVVFSNCYGELVYWMGDVGAWAAGNIPVTLDYCEFNFGFMGVVGRPAWMATGGALGGIIINGGKYTFEDIAIFRCPLVVNLAGISNATIQQAIEDETDTLAMRKAHNLTLGILSAPTEFSRYAEIRPIASVYFLNVSVPGTDNYLPLWPGPFVPGGRAKTLPWCTAAIAADATNVVDSPHPKPKPLIAAWGKGVGGGTNLDDLNLSTGQGVIQLDESTIPHQPGDVLIDDETGTVFRVESVEVGASHCRNTVTPLTNLKGDPQVLRTAMTVDGGTLWLLRSGVYAPRRMLYGDFTLGSATVDNVSGGDGDGSFLTADIGVNDYLLLGYQNGRYCGAGQQWLAEKVKVTARANTGGSVNGGRLALDEPAQKSGTRVPLGYFLRNDN